VTEVGVFSWWPSTEFARRLPGAADGMDDPRRGDWIVSLRTPGVRLKSPWVVRIRSLARKEPPVGKREGKPAEEEEEFVPPPLTREQADGSAEPGKHEKPAPE
ncbi:hypothetical protein, partial [Streptomyces anulatus]|uniref:hypothetical protein n=1 Tax=Streptomyces anulatus TaxID=1892 RepID=UPI0034143545